MSSPVIDPAATDPAEPTGDAKPEGTPPELGDAGKQAIDRMKAERDAEKAKRRAIEAEFAEFKKPKPPAEGEAPDVKALIEADRAQFRAEQLTERALDKIETRAAKLFANPEDARMFLESKTKDFIDGSKVDVEAIDDALAELLKARPYLGVAQGGTTKRFEGSADGGPKGTAGKPQLTSADMKRMYAAGQHDQINAAREAGQFNDLLGIKP